MNNSAQPLTTINTRTVREAVLANPSYHEDDKITVIKRDGKIVVRCDDGGSCRNAESKAKTFAFIVREATGLPAKANVFDGQKNLYAHTWLEAIIEA